MPVVPSRRGITASIPLPANRSRSQCASNALSPIRARHAMPAMRVSKLVMSCCCPGRRTKRMTLPSASTSGTAARRIGFRDVKVLRWAFAARCRPHTQPCDIATRLCKACNEPPSGGSGSFYHKGEADCGARGCHRIPAIYPRREYAEAGGLKRRCYWKRNRRLTIGIWPDLAFASIRNVVS
jgi:hypothetical protein